ncbi:PIN domain-containing protein [Streptomyces sp. NBC_00454]|uniref:PIN domain-containing protein n=1 Tax=Streptomyces sp. NBC_00454 TaxID=2975747 RepID=UPI00352FE195
MREKADLLARTRREGTSVTESLTRTRTLVLDSEGLSKYVSRDRETVAWLAAAFARDVRVVTSTATLPEVVHPRINVPALRWAPSRMVVEPVTEEIALAATALLREAGLHGHKYAIDAMLAATALAAPGPVTVLTSDPEDLTALCGSRLAAVKV